jgi:hypothetical protein
LPDPEFNAYRRDLADLGLVGRVMASHYAEPVESVVAAATALRTAPSADAPVLCELAPGDGFTMVDDSLGWAWGYAGKERRVGYVPSGAVSAGD